MTIYKTDLIMILIARTAREKKNNSTRALAEASSGKQCDKPEANHKDTGHIQVDTVSSREHVLQQGNRHLDQDRTALHRRANIQRNTAKPAQV